MWLVCAAISIRPVASEPYHHLDRLPFVHRPVAVRHIVEAHDTVEDTTGFDPAFDNIRHKLLNVRSDRGGSTAHGDVVVERRLRRRHRLALGNADAAHCATRTRDADCGEHRLFEADALQDRVDAESAGDLAHALNRLVAAFADYIRCAELFSECDPVRMSAEEDNLLGAEASRSDDTAQTDGAVSDNGDRLPRPTLAATAA